MSADAPRALGAADEDPLLSNADPGSQGLDWLARVVSYVLNPLLLFAGCFFIHYAMQPSVLNLTYAWVHLGSLFLLFAVYFLWLRAKGQALDFELRRKADRSVPLSMTFAALIVLGGAFWRATGSGLHVYTNMAAASMFLAFWLITNYWKVSLHALTASFVLTALFLFMELDWRYWPLLLLAPLVVWARVHLGYHDVSQSLVGLLLGASSIVLLQWLVDVNPLRLPL